MVIFHSYVSLPEGMHWWKQHQPLWYESTKAIPFDPKMIQSPPHETERSKSPSTAPDDRWTWGFWEEPPDLGNSNLLESKKTGLLASKKTMSSWHFLCKLWKVVAPPQWNVFLIHVCYIWWHRYIHICVHTDISTIHLTTILIKWIQMNQLSGSELYGIVCKKKHMLHPNVPC